jgi:ParB-like chromosome segregation protein Spo0J
MAVTFDNDTTKRTATLNADYPENIQIDPELSGRSKPADAEAKAADAEALTALIADILKHGQRTPALCRKNEDGQPVLVYGHRRHRAITIINDRRRKTGEPLIQLEFTYEKLTPEQAFIAAIAENRFRKDLSEMDDCHNITVWQTRFKKSLEQIAEIYFPEDHVPGAKSADKATHLKWVKDRAKLTELVPEAAQAVRDGSLKITSAVKVARLSPNEQKKLIAEGKGKTVKGNKRIRVSDVPTTKRNASKATPAKPATPAVKPTGNVYSAAEALACAIDVWQENPTSKTEKDVIAAHAAYRALVPKAKKAA